LGHEIGGNEKMCYSLKEIIKEFKERDNESDLNTKISVYITSIGNDSKRHTIVVDPDSKKFYDTIAIISFENCTVFDTKYVKLSGNDRLLIIIVDLDKHYENATFDKWWRK
jgi:hypothetical protein